ncbi:MAG: N-acetylglucosamine-6-phosphate deacetylase [Erysipelotrichaceae bacterium]|jgi:N-acetylglucosamine-6-phosphate deacetylase|nr:N-acetylglucosamine-6-phosphate deacetylase [Erysipelotrichaceae bacterium]
MILQGKRVWLNSQFVSAALKLKDGKIEQVLDYDSEKADIDYGDAMVLPGFIDVHCHGAYGFDTNDATIEGIEHWAKGIAKEGLTGFLPTTVTHSPEVLTSALKNVARYASQKHDGAAVLGVHFEGPYLNMKNKGAQPPEYILAPSVEQFKKFQEDANGLIKYITLAVEEDPDFALTRYASQNGVVVSIGHSGATYQQAMLGYANGATSTTHTFNGMNPLNHRQPNLVGAVMRNHDVYGEIIADGNHVVWPVINILANQKGKDHLIMVTDSLSVKGSKPGIYLLGGHEVEMRTNGSAYLVGTDTLAGSTLKFNEGLRNLVEYAELPFEWAINALSANPARCLGLKTKGRIVAGYDADLAILKDDYAVIQTYVNGKAQL